MNFAQPIFLWTLTALSVPLAIHLLSRKEGKIVKVGSLRHMEASTTSRFKSLRLNEVWLLLARCLMIVWLALFLSGASCSATGSKVEWLLTEQGMDQDSRVTSLIDSLTGAGFEWRTLTEGFPTYNPSDSHNKQPDYRALTEEISQKSDHNVVVISYNFADGFRQKTTSLPENVRWIPIDPQPKEFLLMASRMQPDSILLRTATSTSANTSYSNRRARVATGQNWFADTDHTDSVHIGKRDTIRYTVAYDAEYNEDARILKAAIQAVASTYWIALQESDASNANWIFWLQEGEPARPLATRTVLMNPGPAPDWFTRVDKLEWQLNRRVTADDALKDHLTVELARTFASELPARVPEYKKDMRTLPDALAWSPGTAAAVGSIAAQDASLWLILLFLVTWITERTLALRKNL